jgi:hypothetical protein
MHRWYTPEEIQFVKKNIKGCRYLKLLAMFNKKFNLQLSLKQFETLTYKHGLRNGVGKFKPGHKPFNKGIDKKTWKKICKRRKDYIPVGSERTTNNQYKEYVDIKIGEAKWKRKHVLIWEEANGKVPKGHVVIFADGNQNNFDLDNLLLVSRKELGVMNASGLCFNNRELTKTGKAIADIKLLIGKRKRKIKKGKGKKEVC